MDIYEGARVTPEAKEPAGVLAVSVGTSSEIAALTAVLASAALGSEPSGRDSGSAGQLACETECVDMLRALSALRAAADAFEMRTIHSLHAVRASSLSSVPPLPGSEGPSNDPFAAPFLADETADAATPQRLGESATKSLEAEIALAQKEPRYRGARALEVALAVVDDMPRTFEALASGVLNRERCEAVYLTTAPLSSDARAEVDELVCGDPQKIAHLGSRDLRALAADHAQGVDRLAAAKRRRTAEKNRHVTLRPLDDGMAQLTAIVPAQDGAAIFNALSKSASKVLTGPNNGNRALGAIMADLLLDLVVGGPHTGEGALTPPHSVEVQLVMTERTLFSGDSEPAHLAGYGTLPADVAREIVERASADSRLMIRRVFTAPSTGDLVGLESRARIFPSGLKRFIELRHASCATPWCDASIRHTDHVVGWAEGGLTTVENGQGLCEACNYVKQQAGWSSNVVPGGRHSVATTTPTGHRYLSIAPEPPGMFGDEARDDSQSLLCGPRVDAHVTFTGDSCRMSL
ncbi:DUF222 domain-containing protein [Neomicrococcus lactis]